MKRAWLYQCCWLRIETIDNTHICMKRMKRSSLFILLYVIVPACNKDWERTRVCVEFKVGDGIKFHASDWSTQNDTWMKHCINHLLNSDQLPNTTTQGLAMTTFSSFPLLACVTTSPYIKLCNSLKNWNWPHRPLWSNKIKLVTDAQWYPPFQHSSPLTVSWSPPGFLDPQHPTPWPQRGTDH